MGIIKLNIINSGDKTTRSLESLLIELQYSVLAKLTEKSNQEGAITASLINTTFFQSKTAEGVKTHIASPIITTDVDSRLNDNATLDRY